MICVVFVWLATVLLTRYSHGRVTLNNYASLRIRFKCSLCTIENCRRPLSTAPSLLNPGRSTHAHSRHRHMRASLRLNSNPYPPFFNLLHPFTDSLKVQPFFILVVFFLVFIVFFIIIVVVLCLQPCGSPALFYNSPDPPIILPFITLEERGGL